MNKWTYKINIKHVIKLDVIMQYQIRFYNLSDFITQATQQKSLQTQT